MVDNIITYIRNLIFAPSYNRKRRGSIEEYEVNPKVRRTNSSLSNTMEDDWHSTSSSSTLHHSSAVHNPSRGTKLKPSWSKENVTVTIDDDEDILEVAKVKQKAWLDPLKPTRTSNLTSTPNFSSSQRLSFRRNRDEDVTFLKYTQSSDEKKINVKKEGFDYIKPFSYLNNQNKETINQNGNQNHQLISPIFGGIKNIKSKLGVSRRPPTRSTILDQSFRLDEKAKYRSLLAQSTSSMLQDSFAKYTVPTSKLFKHAEFSRGKKLVDMACEKNRNFIDLTCNDTDARGKISTKATIKRVLNNFENEAINVKDSDSDVEILPMPPSPKPDIQVERINSLKKVIDTSEHSHEAWLKKMIQKYKDDVAKCEREIHAETRRRNKLGEVTSEVFTQRLEDQIVKCLHIKDAVLPVSVEEAAFPELTVEDEARIDLALSKHANPNEVLVQKFNLNITRRDIQTLAGLNWLNDEVINFYMNLILQRGKDSKWPSAYTMNTFFYPKLLKDGPGSLKRWTRRVDIFSYDIIAVPIHLGVHWCMAIIDFRSKSIKYYDSMGSANRQCLEALLNYLKAEHFDKKNQEFKTATWSLESVLDIPQQMNGSDCGMFSCTFAEFLTRNSKITFSQEDMPYLRRKMVLEILSGELLIQ